jgi:3-dehydroquinate dehydratase-1
MLELRVDHFHPGAAHLLRLAPSLPLPRIITVRHASEGGAAGSMSAARRKKLYLDFLPVARFIDMELRWAGKMAGVIQAAKDSGIGVILSHHDFQRTPPLKKLQALAREAKRAGADIFKVATLACTPHELAVLIDFLGMEQERLPISAMGMGAYGKISRLALAQAGSCLNYGYLGSPNASGQWPVAILKARIAELRPAS